MLKDKVYQMFICGTGKNLNYALENNLGGVIFFAHDIPSKEEFIKLIKDIKSKSKTPLFLSIDQEGGRVERTENIHPRCLSPKYAFEKGEIFLREQTKSIITELEEYGLNMNYAPCLDVNSNPNNPIIGERAFSDNPEDVKKGYDIVSDVYSESKIIPVIKHFPGHGDADKDSHKELPEIDLSLVDMEKTHIQPFKHAIEKGADFVMVAHLYTKCFGEKKIPTSLNKNCIDYLRNTLNFKGITISDDMYMKGVSEYGAEGFVMGIKAGINMFICRDTSDETTGIIEYITDKVQKDEYLKAKIEDSYNKIISMKEKYKILN